MSYEYDILH